jgi:hypothetical protein
VVGLIALHDIGKFAEGFQCKAEQAWSTELLGPHVTISGVPRQTKTGFDLREVIVLAQQFAGKPLNVATRRPNTIFMACAGKVWPQPRLSLPK